MMKERESLSKFVETILRVLVGRGRWTILALVVLGTLFFAFFAVRVQIDSSNSLMISQRADLRETYADFRDVFGNDQGVLLAVGHPQPLSRAGLLTIDGMTRDIEALDGIKQVFSLTNAEQLIAGDFGPEAVPLVDRPFDEKQLPASAAEGLERNPQLARLLISGDRDTAVLIINLVEDPSLQERALVSLENLLREHYGDSDWHLTGVPLQKMTVSRLIQRDQQVIIPLCVVVLGTFLLLMFRRLSGLLLPLSVMGISLCWTIGIYTLSGFALNTITALLPPVIMVLSISTTVHLYSGWLQLAGKTGDRKQLIVGELRTLFLPCLFTALTTALGLSSLAVCDVPAVKLFGLFAAVGVLLSFGVSLLVVPAVLSFLEIPAAGRRLYDAGILRGLLETLSRMSVGRPRLILALSLLLAVVALSGLHRIHNNTDLVRFLKPDVPLYRDTLFIERAVGGVNSLEYTLTRRDRAPLTGLDDITRLQRLQALIDERPQVAGSYSLLGVLEQLNRADKGLAQPALPEDQNDLFYLFDLLEAAPEQGLLRRLVSPDFSQLRLSVRVKVIGSAEAARLVSGINRLADEVLGGVYHLRPTGDYYQLVSDSNRLVANVTKSFSLSLAMILIAILLLFRSFTLLGVALIPNLVPLAWTAGLMGAFKIDLSTGTAMIAAVVIGLTVDSTIHYLARFRRVYAGSAVNAVQDTTAATGRALTISALVLFFGFAVGGLSSFLPTVYFSLLTGMTMLGALVCDLLVLPACLVLFDAKKGASPR